MSVSTKWKDAKLSAQTRASYSNLAQCYLELLELLAHVDYDYIHTPSDIATCGCWDCQRRGVLGEEVVRR